MGSTPIAVAPSQPPITGDFDGDGVTDFVVVDQSGSAAGYALAADPGIRALFVAVLALIGAMLLVAAVYVPPPASAGSSSWRRAAVGRRRGRTPGMGARRPGGKSKRATD